jgi:hypothetical protein
MMVRPNSSVISTSAGNLADPADDERGAAGVAEQAAAELARAVARAVEAATVLDWWAVDHASGLAAPRTASSNEVAAAVVGDDDGGGGGVSDELWAATCGTDDL